MGLIRSFFGVRKRPITKLPISFRARVKKSVRDKTINVFSRQANMGLSLLSNSAILNKSRKRPLRGRVLLKKRPLLSQIRRRVRR
ncbi:MAG: hypothetical protein WCW13_00165 [archaeon]|jgi:hypothetical protein